MKFHITHTHTPENCPLAKSGSPLVGDWNARAKEVGVDLISAVVDQPGHTLFFIVETDDITKLQELLAPFLGVATADITPVKDVL